MNRGVFLNSVTLVLLMLTTACTTPRPTFDSKRDSNYTQKLDRVLLVTFNEEKADAVLGDHFSRALTDEIASLLNKHGVQAQVSSPDPKGIDTNKPILESMKHFQPHQVLHFGVSEVRRRNVMEASTFSPTYNSPYRKVHSEVANVVFSADLKDVRTFKTVWRSGITYGLQPEAQSVANDIVNKLVAENLVREAN
jgi:hypothetical protein